MYRTVPTGQCRKTGNPTKVVTCYLTDGSRIFKRGQSEISDYKNESAHIFGDSSGVENALQQLEREVELAQETIKLEEKRYQELQQQERVAERDRREAMSRSGDLRRQSANLAREIEDVNGDLSHAQQRQRQQEEVCHGPLEGGCSKT